MVFQISLKIFFCCSSYLFQYLGVGNWIVLGGGIYMIRILEFNGFYNSFCLPCHFCGELSLGLAIHSDNYKILFVVTLRLGFTYSTPKVEA